MRAAIVGIAGPTLGADEISLFRAAPPAGVILFARNVVDPPQLSALTSSLRAALPDGAVIMVDQEGGRVARLRPPHWTAHPPAARIGALFGTNPEAGRRAAWLTGYLIGWDCRAAGIDVATAPVLDLAHPFGHAVIGDRAFSAEPATVATLGAAMAAGLVAAGVAAVMKHAPGHGRALADSHAMLPVVTADAATLLAEAAPFAALASGPEAVGWAMTAHVLYPAWDAALPATLSATVIDQVVRGAIGFRGVLVSDDLLMGAVTGTAAARAAAARAAGCDLALHCSGLLDDSAAVLDAAGTLPDAVAARLRPPAATHAHDTAALLAERDRLLA